MIPVCPACGCNAVRATGSPSSPILIIGEFPGDEEVKYGRVFVGSTGDVFRKELARVDMDLNRYRATNLWIHEQTKDERCFNVGRDLALEEAKGKKAILLVGSETVLEFTGYSISDVCGLQVESALLSAPIIYACYNPAIAFHRGIGELRMALEKFAKRLEKEGII